MHAATVNKLRKNERINTDTIDKLCEVLECRIEDIMEYVPNDVLAEQGMIVQEKMERDAVAGLHTSEDTLD